MKKVLLVVSPLCLGLVSGIALVIACNGSSKSSAQSSTGAHTVVDSAGTVLGTLLGSGPGFSSTYDSSGTATAVAFFAFAQMHTFLDANSHIWNVGGDGTIFQPESAIFYTVANCTGGTAYVADGDPKVISKHAGSYWSRSGTATTITPISYYPAGSPAGTCEVYPPPSSTKTTVSALPVSSLIAATPPTIVPPVTIN